MCVCEVHIDCGKWLVQMFVVCPGWGVGMVRSGVGEGEMKTSLFLLVFESYSARLSSGFNRPFFFFSFFFCFL